MPSPLTLASRVVADAGAVIRLVRGAPSQIERALDLAQELAQVGAALASATDRFDQRFEAMIALGEQLDSRADELITLVESMRELGYRFDERGGELIERANRVAETGEELIAVLPAFERAVEMATPLEGAIDRFGRFVDLLPGGAARRRAEQVAEAAGVERRRAEADAGSARGESDPDSGANTGPDPTAAPTTAADPDQNSAPALNRPAPEADRPSDTDSRTTAG